MLFTFSLQIHSRDPGLMLALMTGYALVLEVISGSNLVVPSHRIPAGLYVVASTVYGQYNTAIKIITAEYGVHWNDSLTIQGRPLVFPQWLMPIFPNNSKIVNLEIRASFETVTLGRGEVMCRFETSLQELLVHGKEFTIQLPVAKTPFPSLVLKARRVRPQRVDDHGTVKPSEIDLLTDAAHEAYALYRTNNQYNDLDSALKGFRTVLDQCPDGHPQRAPALSNLAHVILYGFTKGVQTDIDHAISLFCSALTLRPQGHPDHPLSIFDLCKAYYQRYLHLQDHTDLRKAVKLYIELLPNCPQGSYLQVCVIEECNLLPRNPSNESISLRRMILDLCPRGHQYHARSLNRLAGDLYTRFKQSSNIDYINEAVHLSREALAECSGDGERSFFLSVLSYTLKLRFHRLRSLGDIDECIALNREALSLRPPGHPGRQKTLNNVARALKARYDQYGNTTDLEEAIHLDRVAHDLRSETSMSPPPPSQHSEEHPDTRRGLVGRTPQPQPQPDQQEPHLEPISNSQQMKSRNVVIFGESGSGKSSVINAIAQRQRAQTSSSAAGCTFRYEKHKIDLSGEQFVLFDTVGLDEGAAGTVPAAEAVENLKNLLRELMNPRSDGIGLLVYCVRSVRISRALLRNYNLFYSSICRKKVPIVVVVTGLENQEPTMDSWWDTNEKEFRKYGMQFKDHACVTTLREGPNIPDVFTQRITESSNILRSLILENYSEWVVDERWFKLSFADVRNMISDRWDTGRSSPRTLIICDPAQKDVEIASGIHCAVETCFVHINGEKYQVHSVTEPKSPAPISNIESDLLIYYVRVDEQDSARQRFRMFCAAYHGNVVPVIVVVQGLDNSKAAEEWIGRHLVQNDTGRPFAAFIPTGDFRDRNAEQELRELIRQSSLVRSGERGEGVHKSLVNVLGRWL